LNESSKQSLETELSTDNDSIETVVESVKDVMQETDVAPLVEEVVE